MIRRPLRIVALLLLIALGIVTGGWFYARHLAIDAIDNWVVDQRAKGTAVDWPARTITGWPLRLDGLFATPFAVAARPDRTLTWQGPDTDVRFYLLAPDTIDFSAPGRHHLTIADDGGTTAFTLDATTLEARADASLTGFAGTDISAGGSGLALRGPDDAPLATIDDMRLFWQQPASGQPASTAGNAFPPIVLRTALQADGLTLAPGILPPTPAPILGNEIAALRVRLAVNGSLDPRQPVPETLAAWRAIGGTIDIELLEIVWGPVRLTGDGTLALDAALQPEGAFAVRVSGLAELLTAMENVAMIDSRTAAIARLTLAVLTRPSENGGPPEARVPLTIQNRTLSVGPVALLQLPPLVWR